MSEAYDGDIQMIDSSSIRVHQHAANTKKDERSRCMGRSRGGLTTKIPRAMMEEAALAAERVASGRTAGLCGHVRVTATEWFGTRILSRILGAFCARHFDISVELITESRLLSLTRREADLAFRLRRFDQDGLIQRKVAEVPFGLDASAC